MTKYQLSIRAESLPKHGIFHGIISPYATVRMTSGPKAGKKIGRTETVPKTADPSFVKIISIRAQSNSRIEFEVTVFDDRGKGRNDIKLGEATFEATSVNTSPGHTQSAVIHKSGGRIYVSLEESVMGSHGDANVRLQLRGLDIRNVEAGIFGLGRSDPFFVVHKRNSDHTVAQARWRALYRSPHKKNSLNPLWEEFQIGCDLLCNGDLSWPLKIEVFDHNSNGKHTLIGEFETTLTKLIDSISIRGNADRDRAIPLSKESKQKTYGLIVVLKAELDSDAVSTDF